VPCTALATQIAFCRDVLGFTLGFEAESYAFLHHDGAAVRLVQVDADVDLSRPEREGSFYIDVEDLDGFFAQLEPRLRRLAQGRVRPPFDQPYGQREFHVLDEDCTLICFGEPVAR